MSDDVEMLFDAARKLSEPAARKAFLDAACAGQPGLRRQIDELLEVQGEADNLFEQGAASMRKVSLAAPDAQPGPAASALPDETPGSHIGRYKLLEKIGEGGCGVVYMAEQEDPVRRKVALKIIKLGLETKSVIARFEAERQALALMDHPNIAKILDGGVTGDPLTPSLSPSGGEGARRAGEGADGHPRPSDGRGAGGEGPANSQLSTSNPQLPTGRPYFVMELVRGVKITEYCDEARFSTRDRLDLFIKVCQAIQHAHQKGIIHRDIKPSNILVTINDGVAVPKVIDFGIAKAIEGRLTDKTLFTQFEALIGTPAYMSPEQAVMTSLDIDTRSDIYSLGVLLYEMLTGKTPFDAKELMASGIDAMRKTIREKEPMRPSTKLSQTPVAADVRRLKHSNAQPSTLNSQPDDRASSRRLLRIKEIIHQLQGDLDWIVMKCLEKDRARSHSIQNSEGPPITGWLAGLEAS